MTGYWWILWIRHHRSFRFLGRFSHRPPHEQVLEKGLEVWSLFEHSVLPLQHDWCLLPHFQGALDCDR